MLYKILIIINCILIVGLILLSMTEYRSLMKAVQIVVFVLSVYLFYTYSKRKNRRRR